MGVEFSEWTYDEEHLLGILREVVLECQVFSVSSVPTRVISFRVDSSLGV